jgi:hypothetical protein
MTDLTEFFALAETGTAEQVFTALQTRVQAEIGAVISSASVFDIAAGKSSRIFTNLPDIYPVSGLKDIVPNAWTKVVLDARQTFVSNTLAEIATVFPDHLIIGSLGCGAVINMPVFLAGRFMGTVNILNVPGHYTPARVAALQALRPAYMLAFAMFALTPG